MPQETQNPQDPQTPINISFSKSIFNGASLDDIKNKQKLSGLPVYLETQKEFASLMGEDVQPAEVQSRYGNLKNLYDLYDKAETFVGRTSYNTFPPTDYWIKQNKPVDLQRKQPIRVTDRIASLPGGVQIEQYHADKEASFRGFYVDRFGKTVPLERSNLAKNHLKRVDLPSGQSFWSEAQDNEYIPPGNIKAKWMGSPYDRSIETNNILHSITKGLWSGSAPVVVKGVGAGTALAEYWLDRLFSSEPIDPKEKGYYKFNVAAQNWANSVSPKNVDEQASMLEDWNSFSYAVSEGVTQLLGIIMTSFATAGTLSAVGGLSAALRMSPKAATRWATQMSLFLGDAEAMAGVQDEMLSQGIPYKDVAGWLWKYGIATHLSESILGAPAEKAGARLFFRNKLNKEMAGSLARKTLQTEAEKMGFRSMGEASKEVQATGVRKVLKSIMGFREKISDLPTGTIGGKVGRTFAASGIEAIEEIVENFGHTMLNIYHNGAMNDISDRYIKFYEGYDFIEVVPESAISDDPLARSVKGIKYRMTSKTDPADFQYITAAEFDLINQRLDMADKVKKGEPILSETMNPEEALAAFFSTMIVFGIGNATGVMGARKTDLNMYTMAKSVLEDPSKEKELRQGLQEMKEEGRFGSVNTSSKGESANEEILSEADERIESIMADLNLSMDIMRRYGVNSIQTKAAINNSEKIAYHVFKVSEQLYAIDQAIEAISAEQPVTPNEELGITTESTMEELQALREKSVKDFDYYAKPKEFVYFDSKGKPVPSKTSEAYSQYYARASAMDFLIDKEALRRAEEKLKERKDDKQYQELLARQKNVELESIKNDEMDVVKAWMSAENIADIGMFDVNNPESVINVHNDVVKQLYENSKKEQQARILGDEDITERMTKAAEEVTKQFTELTEFPAANIPSVVKVSINKTLESLENVYGSFRADKIHNTLKAETRVNADQARDDILGTLQTYETSLGEAGVPESEKEVAQGIFNRIRNIEKNIEDQMGDQVDQLENFEEFAKKNNIQGLNAILDNYQIPELENEPVSTVRQIIDMYKNIAEDEQAEFPNIEAARKHIQSAENLLGSLKVYAEYNVDFYQDLVESEEEGREHSPFVNAPADQERTRSHLRLSKDPQREFVTKLNGMLTNIGDIKVALKKEYVDTHVSLMRNYNAYLNADMFMFGVLMKDYLDLVDDDAKKVISQSMDAIYKMLEQKVKEGDQERSLESITRLFEKYSLAFIGDKQAKAAEYYKIMQAIEKEIHNIKRSLSGKLDKVIEKIYKDAPMQYEQMRSFSKDIILTGDIRTIEGEFSQQGLLDSHEGFKAGRKADASNFTFYILTLFNRINKFGQGAPTYQESFNALTDVVKEIPEGDNIPTYEQESILMQAIGFLFNPDNDFITQYTDEDPESKLRKSLVNNSLLVRGYGGAGKSTVWLKTLLKTYEKLQGKKISVTVFTPSPRLQELYKETFANEDIDITYKKTHDINNFEGNNSDFYILDEASIVPEEMALRRDADPSVMKEVFERLKKPLIMLGDDNQTNQLRAMSNGKIIASHNLNYELSYVGEQTMPMSYVWRTGISQFVQLQNWFRGMRINEKIAEPVSLYWKEKQGSTDRIGGEYFSSVDKVVNRFISYAEERHPNDKEAILVVLLEEHKQKLISQRSELRGPLKDNIMVVEYDYFSIMEGNLDVADDLISGIESKNVFLAIDFNYTPWSGGDNFFHDGVSKSISAISRAGLTAVSRVGEGYLAMVGDESYSKEIAKKVEDTAITGYGVVKDMDGDNIKRKSEAVGENGRMLNLYDADEVGITPVTKETVRDLDLTVEAKEEVEKATRPHRKRITFNAKKAEGAIHVTNKVWEVLNEGENTVVDEYAKAHGAVMTAAMRYAIANTEQTLDKFNEAFEVFSGQYETKFGEITSKEGFRNSILNSILLNDTFFDILNNGISVNDPLLINTVDDEKLAGQPALVNVIGYTTRKAKVNGNNKKTIIPIVDIYDFVFTRKEVPSVREITDFEYHKLRMTAYSILLGKMGFKVNEIKLSAVTTNIKERTTSYYDFVTLTGDEINDGLTKLEGKLTEDTVSPSIEDLFASDTEYHENERIFPGASDEVQRGMYYISPSQERVRVDDVSVLGEEVLVRIEGQPSVPIQEFLNTYQFLGEEKIPVRFNDTANKYDKGKLYSSTAVYAPPARTLSVDNIYSTEGNDLLKARNKLTGIFMEGMTFKKTIFMDEFIGIRADKKGNIITEDHNWVDKNNNRFVIANIIPDDIIWNLLQQDQSLKALLTKGKEMEKDALVQTFKDNGLHISSVDAEPEIGFVDKSNNLGLSLYNSEDPKIIRLRNELFKTRTRKTALTKADAIFENAFKGDDYRDILIKLNKDRLMRLYDLSKEGDLSSEDWTLSERTEGNIIFSKEKIRFQQIVDKLTLNGIKFEERNGITHVFQGKGKRFYVRAYRHDSTRAINIHLDGRRATLKDVQTIKADLDIFGSNDFARVMKDLDIALEDKDKRRSNEILREAHAMLDQTDAMQFIRHNRSVLTPLLKNKFGLFSKFVEIYEGKRGDGYTAISLKGTTLQQKVSNLKAVMDFIGEDIEEGRNWFMSPFVGDESGKNLDYLEGRVWDITQPSLYLSNESIATTQPSEDAGATIPNNPPGKFRHIEELDKKAENWADADLTTKEEAASQLEGIIGSVNMSNVFFAPDMIRNSDGAYVYGRTHDVMITLGKVTNREGSGYERTVPRHEAIHFIMLYLMDPEQSNKVLDQAHKEMVKKGYLDPSLKDTHEYIAEKFENNDYKPTTLLGQFFRWLRNLVLRWTKYNENLYDFLNAVERGFYKNNPVINDNTDLSVDKRIDNEYTKPSAQANAYNVFGSPEEAKFVANLIFTSGIIRNSEIGPVFNKGRQNMKRAVEATFKEVTDKDIIREVDIPVREDGQIVSIRTVPTIEMTPGDYTELLLDPVKNEEAISAYRYQNLRGITGNVLMQQVLGNVDLDNLLDGILSGSKGQTLISRSHEMTSVEDMRSAYMDMYMRVIPMYDQSSKERITGRFVDNRLLSGILIDAAGEVRQTKDDLTLDEWFTALKSKITSYAKPEYRNTIYSFLLSAGNESHPSDNVQSYGIEKVGMQNLINNQALWKGRTSFPQTVWAYKMGAMEELLNTLWQDSFSPYVRRQIHDNRINGTLITQSNSDKTIIKANLKTNIRNRLYQNGIIKKNVRDDLIGPEKTFLVEGGQITRIENGKKTVILSKGKVNDSDARDLFSFMGFVYDDEVSMEMIKDIKKGLEGESYMADHIYHMMLTLVASAKIADDIYSTMKALPKGAREISLHFGQDTNAILSSLSDFYKREGYAMDFVTDKFISGPVDLIFSEIKMPMVEDMWKFIEDELAERMIAFGEDSVSRIIKTVDNENSYEHPPSSTFMDNFPASHETATQFADKVKKSFTDAVTPLKTGNVYNNPILSGKVGFDMIKVFDGIVGMRKNIPFERMTINDLSKTYIESMLLDALVKKRAFTKIPAMMDTLADKNLMPEVEWYSKKKGREHSIFTKILSYDHNLKDLTLDRTVLAGIFTDFVNYYDNLRSLSQKRYNKLKGKTPEQVRASDAMEFRDYIIKGGKVTRGNAITQPGNPYKLLKPGFDKASAAEKYNVVRAAFTDQFGDFLDTLEQAGYQVPERVNKSLEWTFEGETYRDKYIFNEQWHPLLETAFWTHHIFNESVSHITRGSVYHYADVTDYVKRASGLIAPGLLFNTHDPKSRMGTSARVLTIEDLTDSYPLPEGQIKSTDGFSIINPVFRSAMRHDGGGIFGNVNDGALKTVNFNYNPASDELTYFKFAQFPITELDLRNSGFYQQATEMMLGDLGRHVEEGTDKSFFERLKENFDATIQDINKFLTTDEGVTMRGSMVDYIVFESSFKSGKRKVQQFQGNTFEDAVIDPGLNNEDNVIYVPNDTLRLQIITHQDTVESEKAVPTQLLYTITAGVQNKGISERLSRALTFFVDEAIEKVQSESFNISNFLIGRALQYGIGNRSGKMRNLLTSGQLPIDVADKEHIQNLVKFFNDSIKPTMPGQQYVQAPAVFNMYFNAEGQPYLPSDLGKNDDKEELGSYTLRSLDPMLYDSEGKVTPEEIIIPFHYAHTFGITRDMTLVQSMTIRATTKTEEGFIDAYNLYGRTDQEIADILNDIDIQEVYDNLELSQQNVIDVEGFDTIIHIKKRLLSYYTNFNRSLEAFTVRIPTTGAASGGIARVVAFHNHADNTVFISSKKNLLDGSDYDIDALQVYFPAFEKGVYAIKGEKQMQNFIFESVQSFYRDPANKDAALSKIDISFLQERASKVEQRDFHASHVGDMMELTRINQAGTVLVGHFANLQNFIFRFLSMETEYKAMQAAGKSTDMFGDFGLFESKEKANEAIGFITMLVNAATDNAKEGGLLGKLNINEATSPVIAGMIFSGVPKEEIIDLLTTDEELIEAADTVYNSTSDNHRRRNMYDVLQNPRMKQYAYIGENLRRFGTIVSLQQEIKPNWFEINLAINNIELALGRPVISKTETSIEEQVQYVKDSKLRGRSEDHEHRIRESFNMSFVVKSLSQLQSYIDAVSVVHDTVISNFRIVGNLELKEQILAKNGLDGFHFQNTFDSYMEGIKKAYIGQYLSDEVGTVIMDEVKYDMSTPYERAIFFLTFPAYIRKLKTDPLYRSNPFIKRTKVHSRNRANYEMAEFRNSLYLDEATKTNYSSHFASLPENIKNAYRTYQLLTFGFTPRNGSFFDVTDDVSEKGFTSWINTATLDNDIASEDIIIKEKLAGEQSQYSDAQFSRLPTQSRFDVVIGEIVGSDNEGKALRDERYNPFIEPMNSYFPHSTTSTLKPYPQLSAKQLQEFHRRGEVVNRNLLFPGVYYPDLFDAFERRHMTAPLDGEHVKLPTGDVAIVKLLDHSTVRVSDNSASQESENIFSRKMGEEFVDTIVRKLERMFPNVRIRKTDNETMAQMGYSRSRDVIIDGVLFLNTDKIALSTPMHVMGHLFLVALEQVNPTLYNKLYSKAEGLMKGNLGQSVQAYYLGMSLQGQIEELMSYMIGSNTEGRMESFLMRIGDENSSERAKSILGTLKGLVNEIQNFIRKFLQWAFGISTKGLGNIHDMTIQDVTTFLFNKFEKGEQVSPVSSEELASIERMRHGFEEVAMTTGSMQFFENFVNRITRKAHKSMTQRIFDMRNRIKNRGGHLIIRHMGIDEVFTDPDSAETTKRITEILQEEDKKNNEFKTEILGWLSSGGSVTDVARFGKKQNGENTYTEDILRRFSHQVHYDPTTKYMRFSDLVNDKDLKSVYSSSMTGFDPIIALEHKDDDQLVVSIYDIDSKDIDKSFKKAFTKSILADFMNDARAKMQGVTLMNNELTVRQVMLTILANHMMQQNPKLQVNNLSFINLRSDHTENNTVDIATLNKNLKNMAKVTPFVESLEGDIKNVFLNTMRDSHIEYMDVLKGFYNNNTEEFLSRGGVHKLVKDETSLQDKIDIIKKRLITLFKKRDENSLWTSREIREITLLVNTIKFIRGIRPVDGQMNEMLDLDDVERKLFDANSIGNDYVQQIRKEILSTSQKIVNEVNETKQKLNEIFEDARNLYQKEHGASVVKERFIDISGIIFDKLFVRMESGGKFFNTGYIHWTNNPNEATGIAKAFAEQAKNIPKEWLAIGERLTNIITDTLTENYWHHRVMDPDFTGWWNRKEGRLYSLEDAKADLQEHLLYNRGMIPLLHKTAGELVSEGRIWDALKKRSVEVSDVYTLFEDNTADAMKARDEFRRMGDSFFWQFGNGRQNHDTQLGYSERVRNMLGLVQQDNGDGTIAWSLEDEHANKSVSQNMEKVMNYFVMTTVRNKYYEQDVLPIVNGIKTMLKDIETNKDFATSGLIDYINLYTKLGVEGRRYKMKGKLGRKLDNTMALSMSVAGPLVMAGNINIGAIGLMANFMFSFIEAASSSIVERGLYNLSDMTKASGLFFSDYNKATQLAMDHQVVNMTERDLLSFQPKQKLKKHIFSAYYANWTNWAADFYGRTVIMIAQMIHDGSWEAYSYDKKTGEIKYNENKDKRWSNRSKDPEQKALYDNMKKQLTFDRIHNQTEEGDLMRGYDLTSSRRFKTIADKYIIGSYDDKTRSVLANFMVGRMVLMFNNWFMTRITNAVQRGEWSDELGQYTVEKDDAGNFIPKWQRLFVEGYMRTVTRHFGLFLRTGKVDYKNWNQTEKANWVKFGTNLALFTTLFLLYKGLVDDQDDDEKPIPNWRLIRNARYAYESLLVLPTLIRLINEPFAAFYIMKDMIFDRFGRLSIKNFPGRGTIQAIKEPLEYIYSGEEYEEKLTSE